MYFIQIEKMSQQKHWKERVINRSSPEAELINQLPFIPKDVCPEPTAVKACSIWTSFPEGLFHNTTQLVETTHHTILFINKNQIKLLKSVRTIPKCGERKRILTIPHDKPRKKSALTTSLCKLQSQHKTNQK